MIKIIVFAAAAALCLAGRPGLAQDEACAGDAQKFCEGMDPGEALGCLKAKDAELSPACRESLKNAKPPEDGEGGPSGDGTGGGKGAGGKSGPGGEGSVAKGAGGRSGAGGKDAQDGRKQLQPCRQSIEALCKDSQGSRDSVLKCLKEHEAELPAACRTAMKRAPASGKGRAGKGGAQGQERGQKRGKEMEACKADIEKFCKETETGGGRVLKCLREHEEELSEGCRKMKDSVQLKESGRGGEGEDGDGEAPGVRGDKRGGGPVKRSGKGPGGQRGGGPGGGPGRSVPGQEGAGGE